MILVSGFGFRHSGFVIKAPLSPTSADSDESLVSLVLAGDRSAFSALVARHERPLFRFLSKTSSNPADVEDAMQLAFIKAHAHLRTYNPKYRFTTWLFTIALRELRTLARRQSLPTTPLDAAPHPPAPPRADHAPGDLWRLARHVLSTPQYTALWLRHGEDLPPRDIAKVMRRPRVWVSVTLHRACATLRKAVAAASPDDVPAHASLNPEGLNPEGAR